MNDIYQLFEVECLERVDATTPVSSHLTNAARQFRVTIRGRWLLYHDFYDEPVRVEGHDRLRHPADFIRLSLVNFTSQVPNKGSSALIWQGCSHP